MDLGGSSALNWAASQFVFDPLRPSRSTWVVGDDDGAQWESPTGAVFDAVPVFSIADVIEALEDDVEGSEPSLHDE
jgi:hypothetical protein